MYQRALSITRKEGWGINNIYLYDKNKIQLWGMQVQCVVVVVIICFLCKIQQKKRKFKSAPKIVIEDVKRLSNVNCSKAKAPTSESIVDMQVNGITYIHLEFTTKQLCFGI